MHKSKGPEDRRFLPVCRTYLLRRSLRSWRFPDIENKTWIFSFFKIVFGGLLIEVRLAFSHDKILRLTLMQSGELSIFELYLYLCGGHFFDISQNLEFFLLKNEKY
jgi:uncharacterized membrane protein YedE/YeeE